MHKLKFSACCLFVSLLSATSSYADEAPTSREIKKAAQSYDVGRERFREGSYTAAAEAFEAADDFAPSAAALRLAILARKEAGQLDRAATMAALALERHPDDTTLSSEAQSVLDEVSGRLGQVHVTCDTPCDLTLDNRIVHGAAAESRVLYIQPGRVTLRAGWNGDRSQSERVEVLLDQVREVSFYAPALPEVAPITEEPEEQDEEEEPAEEERNGWKPGVFWAGLVLTTAGATTTAILGVNTINNPGEQAIIDNCAPGDTDCELYKQGRSKQTATNVALGTTIALGTFTLISAFLTDWGGGKKKEKQDTTPQWDTWGKLQLRPTVAISHGATIGASGRF